MKHLYALLAVLVLGTAAFGQDPVPSTVTANTLANDYKQNVRGATTANVTIATALNAGDTLDGLTLAAGDRILVKDQSTASQNGIYIVGASPSRAPDASRWVQLPGSFVVVQAGTANKGKTFVCTAAESGTVGSTNVTYAEKGATGAGTGDLLAANNLDDVGDKPTALENLNGAPEGLIQIVSDTGEVTVYNPASDSDAARGTALISAVAAATAGQTVSLGAGTYELGNNALALADNVSLVGAGYNFTTITSTLDLDAGGDPGPIVRPGANSLIEGVFIDGVLTPGVDANQAPIGRAGGAGKTGIVIRNCKLRADSDGIYFASSTGSGCSVDVWDCVILAEYDAIALTGTISLPHTINVYNTTITVSGPSATEVGVSRGIALNRTTGNVYGGSITVTNGGLDTNAGAYVTSGAVLTLYDVTIATSNGSDPCADLLNTGVSSATLTVSGGNGSGTGGAFTTDGTVTYEGAQNAGNLTTGTVSNTLLDAQLQSLADLAYATNAGKVIAVNAGATGFELVSAGAGGATAMNDIGDATADGSVAQGAHEMDFTSTIDAAGESIWTITNTDADAANASSFIELKHNDGADVDVTYIKAVEDSDGTPATVFELKQTAMNVGAGVTSAFAGTVNLNGTTNAGVMNITTLNATALSASALSNLTSNGLVTTGSGNGTLSVTVPGSGILTWLATPSSANFSSAISDETGSGAVVLGTKPTIDLGTSMSSDDTSAALVRSGLNNSGGVTQWDAVYLNSSSQWVLADANGSGTYPCRGIVTATATTGNASTVITRGTIRNDAWNWTPGGNIYLSTTAGGLTQTAPSTTGDKIQVIGYALDADTMAVEISPDYGTAP